MSLLTLFHLFQHPFIQTATDPKHLLDLLAEYKAEIVEEEILDIPEDKMVRFISGVTNPSHNINGVFPTIN